MMTENFIEKSRKWLKENKIFFETVVTLLLGIMAIIISISALQISSHQNQISEMQNQPQFSFLSQIEPSPGDSHIINDTFWTEDSIIISKTGSSMTDFYTTYFVFVNLTYTNNSYSRNVLIPINYYTHPSVVTDSKGEIDKIIFSGDFSPFLSSSDQKGNLKQLRHVFGDFFLYAKMKGDSIDFTIERYIEIKYKDIFGITRDNFYLVGNDGINRLPEGQGKQIKVCYDDKTFYINGRNPYIPGERWDDSYFDAWYTAIRGN